MSDYICGGCKYYDSDICECSLHPEKEDVFEEDTCEDWADDDEVDLEAQAIDAAERKNHRQEVEGEIE